MKLSELRLRTGSLDPFRDVVREYANVAVVQCDMSTSLDHQGPDGPVRNMTSPVVHPGIPVSRESRDRGSSQRYLGTLPSR